MITIFFLSLLLTAGSETCSPQHATEVINDAVCKVGEMTKELMGKTKTAVGNTIGTVGLSTDSMIGSLKDLVVKVEEWDAVDSPKRIGEDITQNASLKVEQGVEEVKETVESVVESSPNELVVKSNVVGIEGFRSLVSLCHLFGFSVAYGMGVWVGLVSRCVLRKCLPKGQCAVVLGIMDVVYFRAMGWCVGAALFGFLVSRGRGELMTNKMEMFQMFNLVFALFMILINLIFVEPRATKFLAQKKDTNRTKSVAAKKLKKINAYSSTLNVSTLVVLTWHLAYIGQLLQDER